MPIKMDWTHLKIDLQTVKSEFESLPDEDSVLKLLENEDKGFLKMMNLLCKLKSSVIQDSVYEHFSLVENIAEFIGSISSRAKEVFIMSLATSFLDVVISPVPVCSVKMEVIRLLNLFLEDTSQEIHQEILRSQNCSSKLENLYLAVTSSGDIELQTMMIECLFRFFPSKTAKTKAIRKIAPDKEIFSAFIDIRGNKFEVDCRNFLNKLNKQNESVLKRVVSFPAEYIKLDGEKLLKPSEDEYDDFWIDFNIGSKRISVFCQPFLLSSQLTQGEGRWETLSIRAQDVRKFECKESGKMWRIAVELKSSAQILSKPGTQNQSHLFQCSIQTIYDAKSALNNTLGSKASSVNAPLLISKKTTNGSEISCMTILSGENQLQSSLPSQKCNINSSKDSDRDRIKEKSSVPCNPMYLPASCIVSQDTDASSSWPISATNERKESRSRKEINENLSHDGKTYIEESQSCEYIADDAINSIDSETANIRKDSLTTQQKGLIGKKQKVEYDEIRDATSVSESKCEETSSVKNKRRLSKTIDHAHRKKEAQYKVASGDSAQSMRYHHHGPMTPGGDGFTLSLVESKCNEKKTPANSSGHSSKKSKPLKKEKTSALINKQDVSKEIDIVESQSHNKTDVFRKQSTCQNQRCGNTNPYEFVGEEDDGAPACIISDSPLHCDPQDSKLSRKTHDVTTTLKSSKTKTKTTLKDVLGPDKNKEKKHLHGREIADPVKCDYVSNQLVTNSGSTKRKPSQKKEQRSNSKMSEKGNSKSRYHEEVSNEDIKTIKEPMSSKIKSLASGRPIRDAFNGKGNDKSHKAIESKFDAHSLSSYSNATSSKSGQLYIEIENTTSKLNEIDDEVIDETQNLRIPLLATDKEKNSSMFKPISAPSCLRQESDVHHVNQSFSSKQLSSKDDIVKNSRDETHSFPLNSSYVFNDKSRNKSLAQDVDHRSKCHQHSGTFNSVPKHKAEPSNRSHSSKGKGENKEGCKVSEFTSQNLKQSSLVRLNNSRKSKERQTVEEVPKRVLRARKNINYNEGSMTSSNVTDKRQLRNKEMDKEVREHYNVSPLILNCDRFSGSKTLSKAFSEVSKCKESWQELNASFACTDAKVKQGITIKHNKMETLKSSFSTDEQCDDPVDPYDFDFECKVRSKEIQHFVPYKSWSFYSPALEIKQPETVSQEERHRRSKKTNITKKIYQNTQMSCQKKISFNESTKCLNITRYEDSDIKQQRMERKYSGTTRKNVSNISNDKRHHSSRLFESQEPRYQDEKISTEYLTTEADTPKSSESGLRFPPLQDETPCYSSLHDENEKNSLFGKSTSVRSELSWIKDKRREDWGTVRGKTYGRKIECALPLPIQISDEENDDVDEEWDIDSCGSFGVTEKAITSFNTEVTSPLEKHQISVKWPLRSSVNGNDSQSSGGTDKHEQILDERLSKLNNTDSLTSDAEIDEEQDQEENCESQLSPKLSVGGSSQHGNNLSFQFEQLFQEVMSKVSDGSLHKGDEDLNPISGIVSGPSSKQRLSKSALKRKYSSYSSSVSFSDEIEHSKGAEASRLVKRRLFMPESESVLKKKHTETSLSSMDVSPPVSINLSPVIEFSKTSSGSNVSVNIPQSISTVQRLLEEDDHCFNQDEIGTYEASSEIMFQIPLDKETNIGTVRRDSDSYDMRNQLSDVFKSVCQSKKPLKSSKQEWRLSAFSNFEESLQCVYSKMKETDRQLKTFQTNSTLLWHQQSQKMKKYRKSQEDSLDHLRKSFDTFTDELQKSQTGEDNLKKSMKASMTKEYEDLKRKLRAKYNAQSLEAIRRCLQASVMLS